VSYLGRELPWTTFTVRRLKKWPVKADCDCNRTGVFPQPLACPNALMASLTALFKIAEFVSALKDIFPPFL